MGGIRCPPSSSNDIIRFTDDPGCSIIISKAGCKIEIDGENTRIGCVFGGDWKGEREVQWR